MAKRWLVGILALTATALLHVAPAAAQSPASESAPWVLAPDMAYGYGSDGKTLAYKLGTNNAKFLLKGAKKVPRNTLFFVGENGQLYMRSGPYLEGNGKFSFGPG